MSSDQNEEETGVELWGKTASGRETRKYKSTKMEQAWCSRDRRRDQCDWIIMNEGAEALESG